VEDHCLFLRISHQGRAVYEDFVQVEHDTDDGDEEEEGGHSWVEEEIMYWMPYHPKISLRNAFSSNWNAWDDLKSNWNSDSCTSLEKSAQQLLSGLAVTLIALPKVENNNSSNNTKNNDRSNNQIMASPRLIVSTVGNKHLMEPREGKNEHSSTSSTTTSSWDIPLETSRMASHFVDSADHARNFMSELQVDLVIDGGGSNNNSTPSLALQFPDILVHDSNSYYYGVPF
jgi:hypothetical protein